MALSPTTVDTPPALQALLAGIIDYAGLFPPARLPLDTALPNHLRYRQGPDAWMLARFILPVRRLGELEAFAEALAEAAATDPVRFSVLGSGGADVGAFTLALEGDRAALDAFRKAHGPYAVADVMEVPWPAALLDADAGAARRFAYTVADALAQHTPDVFYEVPVDAALADRLPVLLEAFADFNADRSETLGLKLRTGGLEPNAFPAPAPLALAVVACRDAGVRFKATAGLHHPVRHYDESVQTRMHGFLNVFGGAVLAHAHGLSAASLEEILAEEDAVSFQAVDGVFRWRDLTAEVDAVEQARDRLAASFGSCSFDEPRDDLRALGLL